MNFSFAVNVEVERTEGKFESRETIEGQLIEALESADPGSIEGDNGGQYEVQSWEIEANAPVKPGKVAKAKAPVQPGPPALGLNLVAIINAWVGCNDSQPAQVQSDSTDELFKQLDILCERFPHLTLQAKEKLVEKSNHSS